MHMTGRHPFLVQLTAAALFETTRQGKTGAARYNEVNRKLQHWAAAHFDEIWQHMKTRGQQLLFALARMELHRQYKISYSPIKLDQNDTDMYWLADNELIERTNNKVCATWRGHHWRISAESFARWIIDTRKSEELPQPPQGLQRADEERDERIRTLQEQLKTHRRRLNEREVQLANLGNSADPSIKIEIEDIKSQIANLEEELKKLQTH
jgi:hypothetical protein